MDTKEFMTIMSNMNSNHHLHTENIPSDPFSSILTEDDVDQKSTSLGFMELLGYQDYYFGNTTTTTSYPSMENMEIISTSAHHHADHNVHLDRSIHKEEEEEEEKEFTAVDHEVEEESSSVVLNGRSSSPNSCSISSPAHQPTTSTTTCVKEKCGGETKTKKKKKEKEPRFAFMTRTEIDHLDDGYRWRKYGQKAVKNSHFPRSYYRCTNASCNVKKRVERCMGDSSYVITTYEGRHNHPVTHNNSPLLIPPFNHHITSIPPAMCLKLEQGGLLQDMLS